MNKRLPEVAAAIKQHDTTGMAESFEQIENRLKEVLISVGAAYPIERSPILLPLAFLMRSKGSQPIPVPGQVDSTRSA